MQRFWNLSGGAIILLMLASAVVLVEGFYLHRVGTVAGICSQVVAKWESAHPNRVQPFTGVPASVDFKSSQFPEAANVKTIISGAVAKGAHFAGHYAVAEWGCGTACQNHAVIDVQTGSILAMGIPSEAGLSYSMDSTILVANPAQNMPDASTLQKTSLDDLISWTRLSRDYYALREENGRASLIFLCTENPFEGKGI